MTEDTSLEATDRLSLLKSRLTVAKAWCKKPHKAWKAYIDEYEIADVGDTDEVKDKVRIGYIFRRTESDLPAIFDDQPDLFFKSKKDIFKQFETPVEDTYDWLWDIQNLEEKFEDAGTHFLLLGMGFIGSPWITKTKKVSEPITDEAGQPSLDEEGQPMMNEYESPYIDRPNATVLNPFKLYFSPETKFNFILDYEHCPYLFEEQTLTKEEIKAKYGKDVDPTEKLKTEDTDVDSEIDKDLSTEGKDDIKRVTAYHYYGCLPEAQAKGIKNTEWEYDKEYHIVFTSTEELLTEENQYPTKPYFIVGNYGLAQKFWKFGDAKHLKPIVQELEQYRSQILKHTRKMANPKPLVPAEADIDKDAFSDPRVGRTVTYSNGQPPSYLSPAPLGQEVEIGVDMARTDLEKTSGTFDLASGGNQSQVKTPRGIQVFSEAADKNVRRKRKKIARFIRTLIVFQLRQLAQNWTPDDPMAMQVLGEDSTANEIFLKFLADENLVSKIDVEIESLSINRVQMKQDAMDLFDLASKFPNVFNLTEIAKDLIQNGFGKRDGDRYLISEDQKAQMVIQNFIAQLGKQNPELAGTLAQQLQNPQQVEMQQTAEGGGMPNANTKPAGGQTV
jgi:hypothetical protein